MARLLGFTGNRPDLGARAIALEARAFEIRRPPEESSSWGLGFYQGGELLLKRRPFDDRGSINFAEVTKDIRADVLVGHIRAATVGALKTENTHPFRYRQWLFADTGTVPSFDALRPRLRDSLPQFLARDVRGDTDAELVFYLFLSFLHDAGMLDRPEVSAEKARAAIRGAVALLNRLCEEEGSFSPKAEGSKGASLNMVVACSNYVIGVRGGRPMAYEVMEGRAALERLYGAEELSRLKVPHLAACKLSIVASDFDEDRLPSGWKRVPERSTVTLTRTDAPVLEAL